MGAKACYEKSFCFFSAGQLCESVCLCACGLWELAQVTVDCALPAPVFSCFVGNAAVNCKSQNEALLKLILVFKTTPDYTITDSGANTETASQVRNAVQREHRNVTYCMEPMATVCT